MAIKELVKTFEYKGRQCVIVKMDLCAEAPELRYIHSSLIPFHNGYVETTKVIPYDDFNIQCEEPTYSGWGVCNTFRKKYFVGFDSGHYNDTVDTKSQDAVEARLRKFVEEIIAFENRTEGE